MFEQPRIALHYLSGWFWVDAVSILPFDVIGFLNGLEYLQKLKV